MVEKKSGKKSTYILSNPQCGVRMLPFLEQDEAPIAFPEQWCFTPSSPLSPDTTGISGEDCLGTALPAR